MMLSLMLCSGIIASMSLDIVAKVGRFKIKHLPHVDVKVRIGAHTGSCCAGLYSVVVSDSLMRNMFLFHFFQLAIQERYPNPHNLGEFFRNVYAKFGLNAVETRLKGLDIRESSNSIP